MKLVPYYRESTDKQGRSGLGMEAQQEAIHAYSKSHDGHIIRSFIEIESGRTEPIGPKSQRRWLMRDGQAHQSSSQSSTD